MKFYSRIVVTAGLVATVAGSAFAQPGKYSWNNLPQIELPSFRNDTFLITDFGAKAGGEALNTESINKAIAHCSQQGGGVVLIPQGVWLSGPVVLKSNVNLHITRAAVLQFTGNKSQYKLVETNFEGRKTVRNQPPISGTDLTNIAITGDGVIDGNGDVWRPVKKDKMTNGDWQRLTESGGLLSKDGKTWYPSESYRLGEERKDAIGPVDHAAIRDFLRPNLMVLTNCKKVLLQNTSFQNSPTWCLHTLYCEHVTFDGIKVRNPSYAQNGDGIDIESCSYVQVKNCTLDCGDDGICIKSGKDEEGRRVGKPSRYIVVQNNVVYRGHGGFVIGSEMSGGAYDIFVSDCSFIGTDVGLRFKTARGRGGIVENIHIRNISMRNIQHDAILFDMYYFTKAPSLAQTNGKVDIPSVTEGTPQFRGFFISDLICEGAGRAMLIRGLPEMSIRDISLKNIFVRSAKGADIIEAKNISLKNVSLQCASSAPLIHIENSGGLSFETITGNQLTEAFFSINGNRSGNIRVQNTNLSIAKSKAIFNYGANASMLTTIN